MGRPDLREHFWLTALLVLMGAGWGLSIPLTKIAVSTGYQPLGLIFWEMVIAGTVLGTVVLRRGRGLRLGRAQVAMCLAVALLGTLLPGAASFKAAAHLPAGVMALVLSLVPMFAFPVALLLGNDRFQWSRFAGLFCGLAGVILLVAPQASLPEAAMVAWIPLALVAPFFYGIEGNVVSRFGTAGLNPIELLFGASVLGAVLVLPAALATGQWINPRVSWGAPELALVASSIIHAVVYAGYVWLVGRAGAVFAAQVSYLVTGFGFMWSITLLSEAYSGWIWGAMGAMFVGLFLVQPRAKATLVPAPAVPHDTG